MSKSLDDLHPVVRLKALTLQKRCSEENIPILIYLTYRSVDQQNGLWLIGRRNIPDEKIVTNARGGESSHNYRASFDCIPLKDGQPWWEPTKEEELIYNEIWNKIGRIAEEVGLDWLGDEWGEYLPWDKGHLQEPGWKYIKEYLLAKI